MLGSTTPNAENVGTSSSSIRFILSFVAVCAADGGGVGTSYYYTAATQPYSGKTHPP